jgi:hypothetical protein
MMNFMNTITQGSTVAGSSDIGTNESNLSSQETPDKGPVQRLGKRFAWMLTVAMIAGFGPMLWFSSNDARQQMFELAVESNSTISSLIADRAAGGMRWERKEAVAAAYANFVNAWFADRQHQNLR